MSTFAHLSEMNAGHLSEIWPGWIVTSRPVSQAVALRTEAWDMYAGMVVLAVHRAEPSYLILGERR